MGVDLWTQPPRVPPSKGWASQSRDSPAPRLDAPGVVGPTLCCKPAPPKELLASIAIESGSGPRGTLVLAPTIMTSTLSALRPCSAHKGSSPGAGPTVGCSIGVESRCAGI